MYGVHADGCTILTDSDISRWLLGSLSPREVGCRARWDGGALLHGTTVVVETEAWEL